MKKINKLRLIWELLESSRKKYLYFLIAFMFFAAIGEVIPIFFIKPLILNVSSSEVVDDFFINKFYSNFNNETKTLISGSILITALFILNFARILNNWFLARTAASAGTVISKRILSRNIFLKYFNYDFHDSSFIITALSTHISSVVTSFINFLKIISSIFICIFIVLGLLIVDFKINLTAILLFGLLYLICYELIKKNLKKNSLIIKNNSQEQVKIIKDSIYIQKDIISNNLQKLYKKNFYEVDWPLKKARADNFALKLLPRSIIEFSAFSITILIALFFKGESGDSSIIFAYIGTLAFGIQRLMPSMQAIFSSFAYIVGEFASIENIYNLEKENQKFEFNNFLTPKKILFEKLELKNISFRYKKGRNKIFKNLNLIIKKGEKIAVIGESGSGKSTLMEIISGLIKPSMGLIYLNEKNIHSRKNNAVLYDWRETISIIHQTPFLINKSILENIALGIDISKIDEEKVINSAKRAFIHQFIESLKFKYHTKLDEKGSNLSGGQIQRIALARSFFKSNSFLIMDEATNALDKKTELNIIKNLTSKENNTTLFFITHNLNLLNNFDRVLKIENGNISEINL